MSSLRAGLVAMLALPLLGAEGGGCSPDRQVPLAVVRAGVQCGGAAAGPSVRRLVSVADLAEAFGSSLGAAPIVVDFEASAVLLVAAGQRPTAGYAVSLTSPSAPAKGGVALVEVKVDVPAPGAMVAQVVTSPCLVVALPKAGLTEVKVAADSALLGAVKLP